MKLQALIAAGVAAFGLAVIAPSAASAATPPQAVTLDFQAAGVSDTDLYAEARFRGHGFHGKSIHKKSYYGGHGYYGKSFKHKKFHSGLKKKSLKHKALSGKGFKKSRKAVVKKYY
ncbi:MAG: hypothetical protein AAGD92_09345 [Pseudomonadota bacterium]